MGQWDIKHFNGAVMSVFFFYMSLEIAKKERFITSFKGFFNRWHKCWNWSWLLILVITHLIQIILWNISLNFFSDVIKQRISPCFWIQIFTFDFYWVSDINEPVSAWQQSHRELWLVDASFRQEWVFLLLHLSSETVWPSGRHRMCHVDLWTPSRPLLFIFVVELYGDERTIWWMFQSPADFQRFHVVTKKLKNTALTESSDDIKATSGH